MLFESSLSGLLTANMTKHMTTWLVWYPWHSLHLWWRCGHTRARILTVWSGTAARRER